MRSATSAGLTWRSRAGAAADSSRVPRTPSARTHVRWLRPRPQPRRPLRPRAERPTAMNRVMTAGTDPFWRARARCRGVVAWQLVAAIACAALLGAVLWMAPKRNVPTSLDLTVQIKVFPTLAPYPTEDIHYRLDTPEVRDPVERGLGWIRIAGVTPGPHALTVLDGGQILSIQYDVEVAPEKTEISVLKIPPGSLDAEAKPKGRVLERGTWKPVAGATVVLRMPDVY